MSKRFEQMQTNNPAQNQFSCVRGGATISQIGHQQKAASSSGDQFGVDDAWCLLTRGGSWEPIGGCELFRWPVWRGWCLVFTDQGGGWEPIGGWEQFRWPVWRGCCLVFTDQGVGWEPIGGWEQVRWPVWLMGHISWEQIIWWRLIKERGHTSAENNLLRANL